MLHKRIRIITVVLLLVTLLSLVACLEDYDAPAAEPPAQAEPPVQTEPPVQEPSPEEQDVDVCCFECEMPPLDGTMLEIIRDNPVVMLQLSPLTPGEELAILHTNMGDITIRFFPEEAPQAVENFTTHAREGFYDGLIFHRVIPGFMIQGGCPQGTGTGGQSIWGGTFGLEPSFNLRHFRGALAMAHAGPGTIGSQFYIVQNPDLARTGFVSQFEEYLANLDEFIGEFLDGTRKYLRDIHPEESLRYFIDNGGTPSLDWFWSTDRQGMPSPAHAHPVFAHVVDGMDVVDAIANTPRSAGDRPNEDMIIESISFFIYGE